jgi:hypothetical protein
MKWLSSTRARRAPPAPRPGVSACVDALEPRTLLSGSFSVRDAEVIEGDSGFPQLAFTITWADSIAVENG